jgi:hypothetical protein
MFLKVPINIVLLGLLLFTNTIMPYLYIMGVPLKALIVASITLMVVLQRSFRIRREQYWYILFYITIVAILFIKEILYGGWISTLNNNMILGLVIMLLIPCAIKKQKQIHTLATIIIFATAFNSLVSFMEYLNYEQVLSLKNVLYSFSIMGLDTIHGYSEYTFRYAGLHSSIFGFSYALAVALPLTFSRIIYDRKHKTIYIVLFIIVSIGLLVSAARSAILAAIIGIMVIFFSKRGGKLKVVPVSIVLVLAISFAIGLISSTSAQFIMDIFAGNDVRITLWTDLINLSFNNILLGIEMSYSDTIMAYGLDAHIYGNSVVAPHNSLLNALIRYGIIGFIGYIILIWINIKEYFTYRKSGIILSEDSIYYVILLSYFLNSLFHNASIFTNIDAWVYLGMKSSILQYRIHSYRNIQV